MEKLEIYNKKYMNWNSIPDENNCENKEYQPNNGAHSDTTEACNSQSMSGLMMTVVLFRLGITLQNDAN